MNTYIVKFRHRYDWIEIMEVEATSESEAYNIADDESDEYAHDGDVMCFDSEMVSIEEVEKV